MNTENCACDTVIQGTVVTHVLLQFVFDIV
jgi:hypothetical protein